MSVDKLKKKKKKNKKQQKKKWIGNANKVSILEKIASDEDQYESVE